jgi:acyl carrier protein
VTKVEQTELYLSGDLQVFHGPDQLWFSVKGFHCRHLAAADIGKEPCYNERLEPVSLPLPALPASKKAGGHWLIVTEDAMDVPILARQLVDLHENSTLSKIDDRTDIRSLLLELYRQVSVLEKIIYICPAKSGQDVSNSASKNAGSLDKTSLSHSPLIALLQTIQAHNPETMPQLYLITEHAMQVQAQKAMTVDALRQSTLWGLGRVIANEHPELQCKMIDIHRLGNIKLLYALLHTEDEENEVTIDDLHCYVNRLHKTNLVQHYPVGKQSDALVCPDANYLVSGGLNGFGFATAQWLARQGARYLTLISQRGIVDSTIETAVSELRQSGVHVMVLQVDVSVSRQVENALQTVEKAMPPLKGIFHAANVYDDVSLLGLNPQRMEKVLSAKAMGAWNLHVQTQSMALDFFVLYSSVSAILGNPGQANYVAANMFLDSLAKYRRAQNLPAITIQWGPIEDVGYLSQHETIRKQLKKVGMRALTSERALDLLGELLLTDLVSVTVADIDWEAWADNFPVGSTPRLSGLTHRAAIDRLQKVDILKETAHLTSEQQRAVLGDHIKDIIAQTLNISNAQDINPVAKFYDLGMDSLLLLELKIRLQNRLSLAIPVNALFQHASVERLVAYIQSDRSSSETQNSLRKMVVAPRTEENLVGRL